VELILDPPTKSGNRFRHCAWRRWTVNGSPRTAGACAGLRQGLVRFLQQPAVRGGLAELGQSPGVVVDEEEHIEPAEQHGVDGEDAGAMPGLWYVNSAYFTGPVRDVEELIGWVEARRVMHVADVRVTGLQIVRWQYTASGMVPIVLASFRQR
jgi:hypothetical protein